jgi:hypothetical protein
MDNKEERKAPKEIDEIIEIVDRSMHNSLVMAMICFTIAAGIAFAIFVPSNNSQIPTKRTGDYTDGR